MAKKKKPIVIGTFTMKGNELVKVDKLEKLVLKDGKKTWQPLKTLTKSMKKLMGIK